MKVNKKAFKNFMIAFIAANGIVWGLFAFVIFCCTVFGGYRF